MARELSVFIAESLAARDLYLGRQDGFASAEVLKLRRTRSAYRLVLDRMFLRRAIREACEGGYRVFHLSAHGDEDGIQLTDGTDVDWPELADLLAPLAGAKRSLVISSCFGGYAGFSKALVKRGLRFQYVFGSNREDGVGFTEACLAWSILYNRLRDEGFSRTELRPCLDQINAVVGGDFVYRRLDAGRYRTYPSFSA